MSKIGNTGITDQLGFRYTCYVATATQNLKDFHNSSPIAILALYIQRYIDPLQRYCQAYRHSRTRIIDLTGSLHVHRLGLYENRGTCRLRLSVPTCDYTSIITILTTIAKRPDVMLDAIFIYQFPYMVYTTYNKRNVSNSSVGQFVHEQIHSHVDCFTQGLSEENILRSVILILQITIY